MGNGASALPNLTSVEKQLMVSSIREKYDALSESLNKNELSKEDFQMAIQKAYHDSYMKIISSKSPGGAAAGLRFSNIPDTPESPIDIAMARNLMKRSASSRVTFTGAKDPEGEGTSASKFKASLARAKSNSQLLVENEIIDEGDSKIQEFIEKLNLGEQTVVSSSFRSRRLTASQHIISPKKLKQEPIQIVSAIYPAHELGEDVEENFPFSPKYLGSFSCHGIEPGYTSAEEVHEKINQDRGCVVFPFHNSIEEMLFVVLDGHGEQGELVSEFAMQQIVVTLESHPSLTADPSAALIDTFVTTNRALQTTSIQYFSSGCTCVAASLRGTSLWIANVGDSRAVLATLKPNGTLSAKSLSRDHKPDDADERNRIIKCGGYVSDPPAPGLSARVWLDKSHTIIGLAMARSLGDYAVKTVGVIPTPEITTFELVPEDKFIIMGSDGVWEFITSQEAVDIVQRHISKGADIACEKLIQTAANRWQEEEGDYRDDITALVITLPLLQNVL
jgi:serine/threonine protein phosphatase PrpC